MNDIVIVCKDEVEKKLASVFLSNLIGVKIFKGTNDNFDAFPNVVYASGDAYVQGTSRSHLNSNCFRSPTAYFDFSDMGKIKNYIKENDKISILVNNIPYTVNKETWAEINKLLTLDIQ